jgi:VWFA-related protein
MRTTKLVLISSALLFGLPALAGSAPPGSQPHQPSPSKPVAPTIKVVVRETVVDITVTDPKGNPVHGLKPSDFTVREDGKVQPIRSFQEFGGENQPAPRVMPKLPPNIYTNLQPPPTGSALNLLLLDGLNTAPADAAEDPGGLTGTTQISAAFVVQKRIKQGAKDFIAHMPPGTRLAVLGLDNNLHVLQGVTSDPALLSAAVDNMQMVMDGRAGTYPQWCAQQPQRNYATLEALKQIAASAAAIKGKKNLIWFSTGTPTITDPAIANEAGASLTFTPVGGAGTNGKTTSAPLPTLTPVGCLPDISQDLIKTYGLLAAAQVAVYPIGARPLGADIMNPIGPGPMIGPDTPLQYGQFVADEQLSFESMADATGGVAFYNSNDLAGLVAQAVSKGESYYTISYVPPSQKYNYGHHSIKITVNQPTLQLAYRKSYDAVDPATIRPAPGLTLATSLPPGPVDMRVAMSRALPISTQILFDIQVEPSPTPSTAAPSTAADQPPAILGTLDPAFQAKYKDKLVRYAVQYAIPARQVQLADAPEGTHKGAVELDIAAYDATGKFITGISQVITMTISSERYPEFQKSPIRYFQQIDLPPEQLFLRAGVFDHTSGKIGTLEIPLTVAKPPR